MTEDIKLRLTKINELEMETKEGLVKRVAFVFKGHDNKTSVDWTLTLRVEEQMPESYVEKLGTRIGSEIPVTLGKGVYQAEL